MDSKWLFRADLAEDNPSLKSKGGYFELLDSASIYLVIIGHQYSKATIEEFERAFDQDKPILAYEYYSPKFKKLPYKMTEFVKKLLLHDVNIRGHDQPFEDSAQLVERIKNDLIETLGFIATNYALAKRKIAEIHKL